MIVQGRRDSNCIVLVMVMVIVVVVVAALFEVVMAVVVLSNCLVILHAYYILIKSVGMNTGWFKPCYLAVKAAPPIISNLVCAPADFSVRPDDNPPHPHPNVSITHVFPPPTS